MPDQTRSGLVSLTQLLVGDPSGRLFTSAQVIAKIQEAQERFVLDTRALTDNDTDTLVAGTREYTLPTDCMDVIRMAHKGIVLTRLSKFDFDIKTGYDWTEDDGTPRFYYVDLDPNNKVYGLYPNPEGADAGAYLTIEYLKIPPALSTDAAVPFDGHTLMAPYANAVAYWAAKELLSINPTEANMVKMGAFNKMYNDLVEHCISTFKHMAAPEKLRFRGPKEVMVQ